MLEHKEQEFLSQYSISAAELAAHDAYFISFCVYQSQNLLGSIEEGLQLNKLGQLVASEWKKTAAPQSNLAKDAFIVMPNHFHAIVALPKSNQRQEKDNDILVGEVIRDFKAAAREKVNAFLNTPEAPLWQPDYHTRPIRNYPSIEAFRRYIADNPASWPVDPLNPESPNPHPSCYIAPRNEN